MGGWQALALISLCAGCTGVQTAPIDADGGGRDAGRSQYTYYQDVKPILDARCGACHKPSGIAPFALNVLDDVRAFAGSEVLALRQHVMPPMSPDDTNCRELEDPRKMTVDERAMLLDWLEGGMPEGDAKKPARVHIQLPADTLGAPTRLFASGVHYQPVPSNSDDYRCFLIDPKLAAPWTFLKSLGIATNNWGRIHHSIVYIVPPSIVASAKAKDQSEPGEGWSCYFGTGIDGAIAAGGYAPGSVQRAYPGGTTIPIAAGTQLIAEVHYHDANNEDPVQFSVASWEFDKPVSKLPDSLFMFNSKFVIPAGAKSVTAALAGRIIAKGQTPVTVKAPDDVHEVTEGLAWGLDFHMHMRGKSARVELVHPSGARECLLNIPEWHDHWQGAYVFKEPLQLRAGDHVEATCEWDNTTGHQPVVNGKRVTPVDLRWGFKVMDEMCNASLSITHP